MQHCPNCHHNQAQIHPKYGLLPCVLCQEKQQTYQRPRKQVEIIPQDIKDQRGEFMDDIEQPHYKGELNKKWVDIYGEKAALERGFSQEEISHATYVYDGSDVRYYHDKT